VPAARTHGLCDAAFLAPCSPCLNIGRSAQSVHRTLVASRAASRQQNLGPDPLQGFSTDPVWSLLTGDDLARLGVSPRRWRRVWAGWTGIRCLGLRSGAGDAARRAGGLRLSAAQRALMDTG